MKALVVIFLILSSYISRASVLIKSEAASSTEFENFLSKNKNFQSYPERVISEWEKKNTLEVELFKIASKEHSDIENLISELEILRANHALNSWAWSFIADLLNRPLTKVNSTKMAQQKELWLCEASFFGDLAGQQTCPNTTLDNEPLIQAWPFIDIVMIENRTYKISESPTLPLNRRVNWTLLSNSHHELRFYGTYEELLQQKFFPSALVSGSCMEFSVPSLSLELKMSGQIYFSDSCVVSASRPPTKTWMQENWKWAVPVAGLVLGAIAYEMRDKKVVIDSSAFK